MDCTSGRVGNRHMQFKQNAMLTFVMVMLMKHVSLNFNDFRVKSAQATADASPGIARLGKVMVQFGANLVQMCVCVCARACQVFQLFQFLFASSTRSNFVYTRELRAFRAFPSSKEHG